MGRYYALHDHERPRSGPMRSATTTSRWGRNDQVPSAPCRSWWHWPTRSTTLVTLWRAGEKRQARRTLCAAPRGARHDPHHPGEQTQDELSVADLHGHRRVQTQGKARLGRTASQGVLEPGPFQGLGRRSLHGGAPSPPRSRRKNRNGSVEGLSKADELAITEFLEFLADRLKVAMREKGTRHDLIDAVFSLGREDDLVRLVARVEALQKFLASDDGANLLVALYSPRGRHFSRAEEGKKGGQKKGTGIFFLRGRGPPFFPRNPRGTGPFSVLGWPEKREKRAPLFYWVESLPLPFPSLFSLPSISRSLI